MPIDMNLRGLRVAVTGGTSGLGLAVVDPDIRSQAAPFPRGTDCSDRHVNTGDNIMTDPRPKIAALVADAFREEEYFLPKIALNEAGYQVDVRKEPVEIYSYFARTGLLDVERTITEARPEDY